MHRIAEKVADKLIYMGVQEEEVREELVYGFEIILTKAGVYIIFLIMAIVWGRWLQGFLFMLSFFALRKYTGGFHMNSEFTCFLVSCFMYIMILYGGIYIQENIVIQCVLLILSLTIIFILAPLEHPNLPLTVSEKLKCRFLSRVIGLAIAVGSVFLLCVGCNGYSCYLNMGIAMDAITLVLGYGRREVEEKYARKDTRSAENSK